LNAIAFFVLAGFTAIKVNHANANTEQRNKQRKKLAQKLATAKMQKKILLAQQFVVTAIRVDKADVVYRSDKDLLEQEIEAGK